MDPRALFDASMAVKEPLKMGDLIFLVGVSCLCGAGIARPRNPLPGQSFWACSAEWIGNPVAIGAVPLDQQRGEWHHAEPVLFSPDGMKMAA